jgi:hypothetical protein
VLYPAGLTRGVQISLGMLVIGINVAIYGWIFARRHTQAVIARGRRPRGDPADHAL